MNLVVPSRMADPEFEKLSTELGLVLKYVKHSNDDEDLARMMEGDERYRRIGAESAELINVVTNSRLALEEKEGEVDMCRAIDEMRRKSEERGMERGMERGDHNRLLESARNLIANTGWDAMEALRAIGVPEADRPAIAKELGVA